MTTSWLTLADVVREHGRRFPHRLATVDGERRSDYPELDRRTTRLANALADLGVREGDAILWLGQNSVRVLELLVAASKLGAVLYPVNWRLSAAELTAIELDLDPAVVFYQLEEIHEATQAVRDRLATRDNWFCHDQDSGRAYEALVEAGSPVDAEAAISPAAPLLGIFTAAFEGKPRAALLTSENLILQALVNAYVREVTHEDVFLVSGPLFHMGIYMEMLPVLLFGGVNVFVRRVDAEEICRLVERERCTLAYLFGLTQTQILEVNADRRYDLSSLRSAIGPDGWFDHARQDTSPFARAWGGYGQTETSGLVTFAAMGPDPRGRGGRSSPLAQVRIIDIEGGEAGVGEVGEIAVRGPVVMSGYRGAEQRTARGFRLTGDLGRREEDGSITFIGPKRQMIKSGNENIYPAEVESCIRGLHGVQDVAIIGVPDPRLMQAVKAVIVAAPDSGVDAEAVDRHCLAHIAPFKRPRHVEFAESLPKADGATDYRELDRLYGGGGYPSSLAGPASNGVPRD
ncbi:AMP-binding protein [Streptomyces sp. NPDC007264]|uniref:AMP-binding protein n=1 Tax=Streptomyces sp. NPDC007264 TaxID=3364777 RepID=UPI0036DF9938